MTHTTSRIPAAEYAAIVKPKLTGVVLILKPPLDEESNQTFFFSSWRFLRERLWLFGFATAEELDTADVRLSTGRQPYMFSSRRWEAPLIDALELTCL
jgi:hypothetical protein